MKIFRFAHKYLRLILFMVVLNFIRSKDGGKISSDLKHFKNVRSNLSIFGHYENQNFWKIFNQSTVSVQSHVFGGIGWGKTGALLPIGSVFAGIRNITMKAKGTKNKIIKYKRLLVRAADNAMHIISINKIQISHFISTSYTLFCKLRPRIHHNIIRCLEQVWTYWKLYTIINWVFKYINIYLFSIRSIYTVGPYKLFK